MRTMDVNPLSIFVNGTLFLNLTSIVFINGHSINHFLTPITNKLVFEGLFTTDYELRDVVVTEVCPN